MAKLLSSTMIKKMIRCGIDDRLTVELPEHHHYISITELTNEPVRYDFQLNDKSYLVEVVLHDKNHNLIDLMRRSITASIQPEHVDRLTKQINFFVDVIVQKHTKKEEK